MRFYLTQDSGWDLKCLYWIAIPSEIRPRLV